MNLPIMQISIICYVLINILLSFKVEDTIIPIHQLKGGHFNSIYKKNKEESVHRYIRCKRKKRKERGKNNCARKGKLEAKQLFKNRILLGGHKNNVKN